jgi:hypothetical protein
MLHLIKLCVGVENCADLIAWQSQRLDTMRRNGLPAELVHRTRQMPKRRGEILDGGSLYWVIKGVIQLRQRIVDLREEASDEGRTMCGIVFDPVLVPTRAQARRPFQGWRYLPVEDAPPDMPEFERGAIDALPPEMRAELAALALL